MGIRVFQYYRRLLIDHHVAEVLQDDNHTSHFIYMVLYDHDRDRIRRNRHRQHHRSDLILRSTRRICQHRDQ